MPKTETSGDLTTDRPTLQPPPAAQDRAPSRASRRSPSCLYLAAATDENASRRSRVESALAAGQLTIRSQRHGTTHTVAGFGELDVATAQRVDDELKAVEATDAVQIVLDLSGLTFMDSSGVHLIARAEERCSAVAKRLALLRGPPRIQRVLELAAADTMPSAA